jgi:hypothetical protein
MKNPHPFQLLALWISLMKYSLPGPTLLDAVYRLTVTITGPENENPSLWITFLQPIAEEFCPSQ